MKTNTILILIILLSSTAAAIGISPGSVVFQNMARGGYGEKDFSLSNPGDESIIIELELEGDAAPWLSITPDLSHATVDAKSNQGFKLKVQLHPSVSTGYYNATLIISTVSAEEFTTSGAGANFMPGLIVKIGVNVTGQELIDYDITRFTVTDTEIGESIEYKIVVKNKGNVVTTPNITVEVLSKDKSEVELTGLIDALPVKPSTEEEISSSLSSTGLPLGMYWLRLTPNIRGQTPDVQEIDFRMVETGAISISGFFSDLIIPSTAQPGEKVKITAYFNNTSIKVLDVKSVCEVFKEGKFDDTVESNERRVEAGEVIELSSYQGLENEGDYSFRCYIEYGKKQSEILERIVSVGVVSEGNLLTYIIYLLIGVTTIAILYLVYSRMKGGNQGRPSQVRPPVAPQNQPPAPPVAPPATPPAAQQGAPQSPPAPPQDNPEPPK